MSRLKLLYSGVAWGGAAKIVVVVFQLLFMAVMARLLEPSDFGLVAIAHVCLRFFSYFSQLGVVPAIIQKEELDNEDIRSALTLSLLVSFFFFSVATVFSGSIEKIFELKNLATCIQLLSINFILAGFSSVSVGVIQREKKFKAQAIIEIFGYLVGYGIVGLGAAYAGGGVWSLVGATLTQSALVAILSYLVVRHPLGFKSSKKSSSHFLKFGSQYSANGFLEFLTSNLDALIVGKFFGAAPVGFYNRAILLANLPVQHPANILTRTLFPILGGAGNTVERQLKSALLSVLIVGCYAFFVSAIIFFAAQNIVDLLLGDQWGHAVPILKILTFSVGPLYISHVLSVTFDSMAELTVKLRVQLLTFCVLVALILIAVQTGDFTRIALAVVVAEWLRVSLLSIAAVKILKIPMTDVIQVASSIAIFWCVPAITMFFSSMAVPFVKSNIFSLAIFVLAGGVGAIISLLGSRYILAFNPSVRYLAERNSLVSRFLPVRSE